jgi:PEP-CTERM motif
MYNALLGFLFCSLVAIPAAAQTPSSVFIDESGPEGTAPIITLSNPSGSSFLQGSTVTAVTCPNSAVLTECWRIDVIVQGTNLSSWGTPMGLELSEPGTPGILSDSFGADASIAGKVTGTSDISFQLFSDDESGTLGGRAFICQPGGGVCAQSVENGRFQAANVGVTICNNLQPSTCQPFDVFLKSDVNATPEPTTFLLFGTGLLCVLGAARRTWLG